MYGRRGVLHLLRYCTFISRFLSAFLFYSWVGLFFYDSMAVYVFVVCMGVCVAVVLVWWGSSLFLAGSSRGWWQPGRTAEQEARRNNQTATADMLRDWKEPSQVRAEATYRDILVHNNLSCTLNHYASLTAVSNA